MADNLVSMFARRCANGATTVLVYAGAGVALVLLPLLGFAPAVAGRRATSGLVGLLVVVGVVAGGLLLESAIVTGEWPRLLRGARPW